MRYILWPIVAFMFLNYSFAQTQLAENGNLQRKLGLNLYLKQDFVVENLKSIKVAIIDYGFDGIEESKSLPTNYEIIEYYPEKMVKSFNLNPSYKGNPLLMSKHGATMAQIVWSLIDLPKEGPKFYLLNGNGLTNFRRAVRYAIEQDVDIILYSQNWEVGGNFDGKGFINNIVNQATNKGILWINSAGNYGDQVYSATVDRALSTSLSFDNKIDENNFSISVIWNDFTDNFEDQSTKDLDFEIISDSGKVLASANLAQVTKDSKDHRKETQYSREKINLTLNRGRFKIRIKDMSSNFGSSDHLRILVSAAKDTYSFPMANAKGEIMTPADNPNVITVGDLSKQASKGKTLDGRFKPEIFISSNEAKLTNGMTTKGTSNSAAFFTAIVMVLRASGYEISYEKILKLSKPLKAVELDLLPQDLIRMLRNSISFSTKDLNAFQDNKGQVTIELPIHPISLPPVYFQNVYSHMIGTGLSPDHYRYFIKSIPDYFSPQLGPYHTIFDLKPEDSLHPSGAIQLISPKDNETSDKATIWSTPRPNHGNTEPY